MSMDNVAKTRDISLDRLRERLNDLIKGLHALNDRALDIKKLTVHIGPVDKADAQAEPKQPTPPLEELHDKVEAAIRIVEVSHNNLNFAWNKLVRDDSPVAIE